MTDELPHDPWSRRYAGEHNAFLVRENGVLIPIARAAVAHRLDVPVGSIVIEWAWQKVVEPVKLRRAA